VRLHRLITTRCLKPFADFKPDTLQELIARLKEAEYVPYVTSVGGSGLGILSPYRTNDNSAGPITPPETPNIGEELQADVSLGPLRASFESKTILELGDWAETRGRWLYV
jgi:hypothetical protein